MARKASRRDKRGGYPPPWLARAAALVGGLAAGCTPRSSVPAGQPPADPPPELRVVQVAKGREPRAAARSAAAGPGGAVFAPGVERPVSVSAVEADVRSVLLTLAEQAGVDLVLGPEVRGRISVRFDGMPAHGAMEAVMAEAGLNLVGGMLTVPWSPTVFYEIPVNADEAGEALIRERFGVGAELARWIVENRIR